MADFQKVIPFSLAYEGGYNDIKEDKGGATNHGISLSFAKSTENMKIFDKNNDGKITNIDIKNLTEKEAIKIYKIYFWDKLKLDRITSDKKAFVIFDASINHGLGNATKLAQRALNMCGYNIKIDGKWGPKTLSACEDAQTDLFIEMFLNERAKFYRNIVNKNEKQRIFLNGWLNRISWNKRDVELL